MHKTPLCQFALLGLIVLFVGCWGPSYVPVSGTVYMDGEPLKREGFVQVVPSDGPAATGKINPADGTFTLTSKEEGDGVVKGEHSVAVIVKVQEGYTMVPLIDEKYLDAKTSGISVTIDGETNDLRIELTGGLRDIAADAETEQITTGN